MKLGKNHIHLLIMLFAVSSLLVHVPSDAFADKSAEITEVEDASYSWGSQYGTNNGSLVQVDSDTYALAYTGADDDGYIATFTIDSDGDINPTPVDTLEHDTAQAHYNHLVKVDSDTYALAYEGSDDLYITTFTIQSDGSSITKVESIAADVHQKHLMSNVGDFIKVDSDTFATVHTSGNPQTKSIITFDIASDGSSITKIDTGAANFGTSYRDCWFNTIIHVDSDIFAVACDAGTVSTISISSAGQITPDASTYIHDLKTHNTITQSSLASQVKLDSDTIAVADSEGISTFDIASDGTITPVRTANYASIGGNNYFEFSGTIMHPSIVQVDSDTYAIAYYTKTSPNRGIIDVYTISTDGETITLLDSLVHNSNAKNNSLVQVDSDTYALAFPNHITTFTISVTNTGAEEAEEVKKSDDCYDCEAPKLTKVEVHITSQNSETQRISTSSEIWHFDQKSPYPMFDDDITPIIADPGDEVQIILELTDNRTLERIADSGTYTNFLTKPNDMNNFYSNNFDKYGKVSTTFYEWHNTGEDLFYDYDQTVEWSPANIVIEESAEYVEGGQVPNLDGLVGTFTISFKMKFLQPMQTTDVWVQGTDRSGNFFKVSLPLTLKVAGNEPLVFESKVNQKVLGFYDESMLNDVVSDWTGSSQDVSELAEILGIPDEQLPPWVANLALWVSEDRISMGDMIVSIEHLINN
ncbi:hypothetical protein OAR84_02525 [Nitrosopumilus sp.]|nr:hypothetical protein [Nitrosopumilus sp.]